MNRSSINLLLDRSPWSNAYDPPLEDGAMPSERLRKLEVDANTAFDQYREMYFEGGVSSVYLWDLDHGFAGEIGIVTMCITWFYCANPGVILIKKAGDGDSKKIKGCWDSIHVVEVQEKSSGRSAHYKLTSTSMLWLQTNKVSVLFGSDMSTRSGYRLTVTLVKLVTLHWSHRFK